MIVQIYDWSNCLSLDPRFKNVDSSTYEIEVKEFKDILDFSTEFDIMFSRGYVCFDYFGKRFTSR